MAKSANLKQPRKKATRQSLLRKLDVGIIASVAAGAIAAVTSIAGIWLSMGQLDVAAGQLKEMEAQRHQDAEDGKSADERQDKLIAATKAQADNTEVLARNAKGQLDALKESSNAALAQAKAAQSQANASAAASRATERMAKASAEQVQAMLSADRAWLGFVPQAISTELVSGQPFEASAVMTNTGRSPATWVQARIKIEVFDDRNPFSTPRACNECARSVVFPGGTFSFAARITPTADQIERVGSGDLVLMLTGRVDYLDANNKAHYTLMCAYFVPALRNFTSCVPGNGAT